MLDGICTAEYKDEDLSLRYAYKVVSSKYSNFPVINFERVSTFSPNLADHLYLFTW